MPAEAPETGLGTAAGEAEVCLGRKVDFRWISVDGLQSVQAIIDGAISSLTLPKIISADDMLSSFGNRVHVDSHRIGVGSILSVTGKCPHTPSK